MIKYLVFPNPQTARDRSAAQAVANLCDGESTLYWWGVVLHPSNGQAALFFNQGTIYDTTGLTAEELSDVVDQETMNTNGWFPESDAP